MAAGPCKLPESIGTLLQNKHNEVVQEIQHVIEDLLIAIQIEDNQPGRLTDAEVSTIQSAQSQIDKSRLLVTIVASKSRETHVRFLCVLYAVRSTALDLIDENLQATVQELFHDTGVALQTNVKENPSLQKEISALQRKGKKELVLFLLGRAGVGMTALANSLIGAQVAPEAPYLESDATSSPSCHAREINHVVVKVWDNPGFKRADDVSNFERVAERVKKPDLMLFCVSATENLSVDDYQIIRGITNAYGKEVWENCLIVVTRANMLCSTDVDDPEEDAKVLNRVVFGKAKNVRISIQKETGMSDGEVATIPCIPAGISEESTLADGRDWLSEFWVSAVETAKAGSAGIILQCNSNRLKEVFQSSWTESGIGEDSDHEMPHSLRQDQSRRVFKRVMESSGKSWSLQDISKADVSRFATIARKATEYGARGMKTGGEMFESKIAVGLVTFFFGLYGVLEGTVSDEKA